MEGATVLMPPTTGLSGILLSVRTSGVPIQLSSSGVYKLMFNLTVVNKILLHCHSWLAGQYLHIRN